MPGKLLSSLLFSLFLAGCFGGEDDANPVNPVPLAKVSPGFYAGDYTRLDPMQSGWESEFTLAADGSFRFFWFLGNTPVGDIRGSWSQRDSNLYFTRMEEAYLQGNFGYFDLPFPIEDDTNAVRDVTEESFTRKEWTLIRQKPYWVTHRRQDQVASLQDGTFQSSYSFIAVDSTGDSTTVTNTYTITLQDSAFAYSFFQDSVEYYQATASWYQAGSVLAQEDYHDRQYVAGLGWTDWDTIPGPSLNRVRAVTDSSFQLFFPGAWETFLKIAD